MIRMNPVRLSFAFGSAETSKDTYIPHIEPEGFAHAIKVNIPQLADTPTATLNIYDLDGDLLFTKGSIAENTVTMIYPQTGESKPTPILIGVKVNITLTAAPGTPQIITVVLYIVE